MTPGARVAAAIEVLDAVEAGASAEQVLTRWARRNRYAGSKDRAAVRDHVFACLRNWRSDAIRGGAETGRGRMIGRLRAEGLDPGDFFSGEGYAPAALSQSERVAGNPQGAALLDVPDWLWPELQVDLGSDAEPTAHAWKSRAPVTLRANLGRATREEVQDALSGEGIETEANPLAESALTVTGGARRIRGSECFQSGLVELQDAASQALCEVFPEPCRVLDYCAGGGGKALALAALGHAVSAHDIDAARMSDLPERATRAGAEITILGPDDLGRAEPFDVVLCDAPCSGSGAWRRSPQGKWDLTPARLAELTDLQGQIMEKAAQFVGPDGVLAYATCSVLRRENEAQSEAFRARQLEWAEGFSRRWNVTTSGDGFYTCHLTRAEIRRYATSKGNRTR